MNYQIILDENEILRNVSQYKVSSGNATFKSMFFVNFTIDPSESVFVRNFSKQIMRLIIFQETKQV